MKENDRFQAQNIIEMTNLIIQFEKTVEFIEVNKTKGFYGSAEFSFRYLTQYNSEPLSVPSMDSPPCKFECVENCINTTGYEVQHN